MKTTFVVVIVSAACILFALNLFLGVFGDVLPIAKLSPLFENAAEGRGIFTQRRDFSLLVEELKQAVSTPAPLRSGEEAPTSFLTKQGVFQWTNTQRQEQGLSLLEADTTLDNVAAARARDMFEKQYFGHVAPDGSGVAEAAQKEEYAFLAIGENLALGNFATDSALVQAWMDSPGHRENIVSPRYQEIGIAVEQGEFEGNTVWIAVQIFGLPSSACSMPSSELESDIELKKIQIEEMEVILDKEYKEIEATEPKRGQVFRDRVDHYNQLVAQYNKLVEDVQVLIGEYNVEAREFNECANG